MKFASKLTGVILGIVLAVTGIVAYVAYTSSLASLERQREQLEAAIPPA